MGTILPLLVGLIAAAVVSLSGNVVGAIIFGIVMAGMTWGAFFWRPGSSSAQTNSAQTSHLVPNQEPNQVGPDMSSLSPREVGQVLALSLDSSCGLESISAQVRDLVRSAGVPLSRYQEELVLLAGFAQDYAITLLLRNDHRQSEVLGGYRHVWSDLARSPEGRTLYQKFLKRCPEYALAVSKTEPGSIDPVALTFSPIALTFGEFLSPGDAGAQILALSLADALFLSHVEGTAEILRRAKLLPPTGHVA